MSVCVGFFLTLLFSLVVCLFIVICFVCFYGNLFGFTFFFSVVGLFGNILCVCCFVNWQFLYLFALLPVSWFLSPNLSRSLIKLRTSNHSLPVETGRWVNTPNNNRLCNLWYKVNDGDEFHYLFECLYFEKERECYLPHFYCVKPNIHELEFLLRQLSNRRMSYLRKLIQCIMSTFV